MCSRFSSATRRDSRPPPQWNEAFYCPCILLNASQRKSSSGARLIRGSDGKRPPPKLRKARNTRGLTRPFKAFDSIISCDCCTPRLAHSSTHLLIHFFLSSLFQSPSSQRSFFPLLTGDHGLSAAALASLRAYSLFAPFRKLSLSCLVSASASAFRCPRASGSFFPPHDFPEGREEANAVFSGIDACELNAWRPSRRSPSS